MGSWLLHDGVAERGPLQEAEVIRAIGEGIPAATVCRMVGETEWRSLQTHAPFAVALQQKAAAAGGAAPRARRGCAWWIALLVVAVLVGGVFVVREINLARRAAEAKTQRTLEEARRAREDLEKAIELRNAVPALRQRVEVSRFPGLDGQCAGKGAPPQGRIYQGARYEENAAVAAADGCAPLSPGKNITNFFCCPAE
jgi:hypothetical protein